LTFPLQWLNRLDNTLSEKVHGAKLTSIADVRKIAFKDSTFDVIIAIGVVAWLNNIEKGLAEVARTLKPGGFFLFSMDNPHRFWVDPPLLLQGTIRNALERMGVASSSNDAHRSFIQ